MSTARFTQEQLDEKQRRLAEVKARLEDRGLLRTADVTSLDLHDTGSPRTIVLPDAGDGGAGTASAIVVAGSPCIDVPCPACGPASVRPVPVNRTQFECRNCAESWRWAICSGCDRLAMTNEVLDAWECRACGELVRSWWRTSLPTSTPARIIQRRSLQLASLRTEAHERDQQRESRRRSTRVAAAVCAVAALVGVLAVVQSSTDIGARGAACGAFDRFVVAIDSGRLTAAEVDASLADVQRLSADVSDLSGPAAAMATAPSLVSIEFQAARTHFAATCRAG